MPSSSAPTTPDIAQSPQKASRRAQIQPAPRALPLDLSAVSLVCVETRRPALAVYALRRCLRQARFKECLLLSARPVSLPPDIKHVRIPELADIAAYSQFMIKELGEYVSAERIMIVQWDGFITDPGAWQHAFLDYDYIGAPWPEHEFAVGNGGFSLRSRKLLEALRAMETPLTHPEDRCICERYRPQLESDFGVRFAPLDVASRYSWEAIEPTSPTFGFHGFFNFHRVLDERELIEYFELCDHGILYSVPARRLLKNLYRGRMREAADQLHAIRMTGPLKMRLDAIKLRTFAGIKALAS